MLDIYKTHYKFSADPFRLSPDYRFSYGHHSYTNVKAFLEYAFLQGEGFLVITGEPGTGKTTLINEVLAGIDATRMQVATLTSTQLEGRDLLHLVAAAFDQRFDQPSKATLLLGLQQFLTRQSRKGQRCVLIVDEAQSLSHNALEELRLLANLQHDHRLLLQICLIGQEQLRDLIAGPEMEHLRQRLIAAARLEPLDVEETVSYIEHRLCCVGWRGDPTISGEALALIHRFSGGFPRRINLICNRLFLHGALNRKQGFLEEDARQVIEDLQKESLLPAETAGDADAKQPGDEGEHPPPEVSGLPRADSIPCTDEFILHTPGGAPTKQVQDSAVQKPRISAASGIRRDQEHAGSASERPTESTQPVPGNGAQAQATDNRARRARRAAAHDRQQQQSKRETTRSGWGWRSYWKVLAIIIALVFLYVALHSGSRQPDVRIAGPDKLGAEVGREPIDTVKKDKQPDTDIVSEPPAASEQEPTQTSTFNALEKAPETRATTAEVVQAPVAPAADIELETPVLAQTESVPPADAGSPAPESVPAMPADAATSSETTVAIVQDLPHASVAAGAYVRTALLGGHWSGQGRPADVFPSENTECNEEGGRILCQMAVNKGGGGVSYQVEARLDGFSTEGDFQVSYRTRTLAGKLDDQQAETPAGLAVASGEAQVSEHTMSCKLIEEDEILCRDPSGAPRYFFRGPRRAGP